MKYMVEDTYNGFRLSMLDSTRGVNAPVRHHYDEVGGHGPVEALFAQTEKTWEELRAQAKRHEAEYTE